MKKIIQSIENGEKPGFQFKPKTHFELGEDLGLMNFETASKLSDPDLFY